MEQLKKYIDDLWENAPKSPASLDFKEELLSNCIERYQDLIDNAEPPESAYKMVIESIGDVTELWRELSPRGFSEIKEKQEKGLSILFGERTFFYPSFRLEVANRRVLDLSDITKITIDYCSEEIRILKGDTDQLILEEYFNRWTQETLAGVVREENVLKIHYGERHLINLMNFNSSVIIYLPKSYHGGLQIETLSGAIKSDMQLDLEYLSIKSKSGEIKLSKLTSINGVNLETASGSISMDEVKVNEMRYAKSLSGKIQISRIGADQINMRTESGKISLEAAYARNIKLQTTSGSISIDELGGEANISNVSGSIRVSGTSGGRFSSTSGTLRLELRELQGEIDANSISGSVHLSIPDSESFFFRASTVTGKIQVPFESGSNFNCRNSKTEGVVGALPKFSIRLFSVSGSIRVNLN